MFKKIQMFTDGSCLGNPGSGGYGTILRYKLHEITLTSGFYLTTNNRMELMAVISGLESLNQSCFVEITTDSLYVKKGILDWMPIWKKKEWKTTKNQPVKNIDLWLRINAVLKKHSVNWLWIKAHIGHIENTRCDQIARKSAQNPSYQDFYYEKNQFLKSLKNHF
ncbi:ribonuclease HI [Buchnera aphidicola (Hyadaphis tataricae)]|uniref:Ribonuclease H n=1 Tax=Buchnera aphidicola (Hyadaphis tataricae) TaxID=1241859 RepID=A0A4D6Y582_9GAMM|nr:ribonuclease HI [Buchnera aphidicola]QCI21554.1 ribonuclease HI [Buchnera aphidicola (Hyadaphis tataricae)]